MATAEVLEYDDWVAQGVERFGPDSNKWAFVCPFCHRRQTIQAMKNVGHPEGMWAYSCIGRTDPEQGCDYAGGGLFRLNPVRVRMPRGKVREVFDWA